MNEKLLEPVPSPEAVGIVDSDPSPTPLLVDGQAVTPELEDAGPAVGSPGWTRLRGRAGSGVGLQGWRHEKSGMLLLDVFNARHDGSIIQLERTDTGESIPLYPGAGWPMIFGASKQWLQMPPGKAPVAQATLWPSGTLLADIPFGGYTSSPRNQIVPGYWTAISEALATKGAVDPKLWLNALAYTSFQLLRAYQASDGLGGFDVDAYGFDELKKWPKATFKLVGPSSPTGYVNEAVSPWVTTHFTVGELCAIYRLTRDPRSYDQAKRLMRLALRCDWGFGEKTGASKLFGDNTRVKGRVLEALAHALKAAQLAMDLDFVDYLTARAAALVSVIDEQWDEIGTSPSVQAPDPRHLAGGYTFENCWMVGLLGWGAAILGRAALMPDATNLAGRCATWLAERAWDAKTGKVYQAVGAGSDIDVAPNVYPNPGLGTARWIALPFWALGWHSEPLLERLTSAADKAGHPLQDPLSVMPW